MNKAMPALVSITFDDGFRCQFEKALPILNRYRLPATFFLIANHNATHDLWSGHTNDWWKIDWREDDITMLKQVVRDGHEIGCHSFSHHPVTLKEPEQAENEVCQSRRMIEAWVGTRITSFCYPFYWSHAYLADAVRNAGYGQARGGGVSPSYVPSASYYSVSDASLERFNVDCRQITSGETVGAWIRPGCWHVLTYHGIGGEHDGWEPITVEEFARQMGELVDHRESGAVDVVTFKDGAARVLGMRT